MLYKKHMNISTVQMYYFIEVAECGSLSRAAQQLYTSQSTLSKCISAIEKTLNVQLFIRNRKGLTLTEAGQHLYTNWKDLLFSFENSVEECRVLQGGVFSSLMLGVLDSHRPNDFAMPAVRAFMEEHPGVHVQLEAYPAQEVRRRLFNGSLDLVFTVLYDIEQLGAEEFDYKVLKTCPHSVCMLKSNPLAKKEVLHVQDLKDSDFVCISPFYTPSYAGMLTDLCQQHGFTPRISRYTTCAGSLPYNLMCDRELFLCDHFFRDYNNDAFCCRPLADTVSGVVAAWLKGNAKKELRLFLELL